MTVLAPLLSGFALIAASALLPEAALSSLRSSTTVGRVGGGSSAAPPRMAVEPSTGQGGGWRARLRTGSTAVAAAALLAVPRGPAQAAEIGSDGAAGISRDVGSFKCGSRRRRLEPAFLGFARKKSGLDMPLDRSELRGNQIDLDAIVSPKMAKRFTERGFIFSDSLTYKGELAEELDELDAIKEDKKGAVLVSTLTTTGGAVGLVYLSVKGLQGIEDYFKRQELKEIEAERELTGQYISVDASDVDTSIDPLTGKNLTISKAAKPKNVTTAADGAPAAEAPPGPFAKMLNFLGLGETLPADDDGFWAQGPSAQPDTAKPPKNDGGGGPAASGGDGSTGGDGGDGGDGLEDDSSAVDGLDDLLG